MADSIPVPLPGEVPFLPQTPEQAAARDSAAGMVHAAVVGPPIPIVPPTAMSVGSPAANDALLEALETAHSFISRVSAWKGQEDEKQQVLDLTAAALQAIAAPVEP